jgi:hypothetical protein
MRSKLVAAIAAALALGLTAFMFLPAAATPPSGLSATVVALGATARPVSVHSNGIQVESKTQLSPLLSAVGSPHGRPPPSRPRRGHRR